MSVHERQRPPAGHGEVLTAPRYEEWAELVRANRAWARSLPAPLEALRVRARQDAVSLARDYSAAIGVVDPGSVPDAPLVVTGHQPVLYHPGVWVKVFLADRFAQETGGLALDLVVDTDTARAVELVAPCRAQRIEVCRVPLAELPYGTPFVSAGVPGPGELSTFRARGADVLATLPAEAPRRHFAAFCDALDEVAPAAGDLATLVTAARRHYERAAETRYLELPVSRMACTPSAWAFSGMLLAEARRFAVVYNQALGDYRRRTGARSSAQPFPDLVTGEDRVETPFWHLDGNVRHSVYVDRAGTLWAGGGPLAEIGENASSAAAALERADVTLAPKALALTVFQRLFVADLFIHGTGGARYDRVTDEVIEAFFGIAPPAYAVASMTMVLPVGCRLVTDADVASLEERLHRLEHNPDQMLDEVEFDAVTEREAAERLARRKADLVERISEQGADRKALGLEIREVNGALGRLMAPVIDETRAALGRAREARDASAILTDRTYPFCLWDPREVADKVR